MFTSGVACKAGTLEVVSVCEYVCGKFLQASDWSKIGILHCRGGIELDDLDEDNISAEAGKQGLAKLFHTQTNIKLPNHIELQNILEYKFLLP